MTEKRPGRWVKGQTGNPRGRPPAGRSLAAKLRLAIWDNFDEILKHHMSLAVAPHDNPAIRHAAIRTAYELAGLLGRSVSIEGSTEGTRPVRLVIEL